MSRNHEAAQQGVEADAAMRASAQPIVRRVSDNPGRSRHRKHIAEEPFFRAAKPAARDDSLAPAGML